jgi:hypothetical protein
MSQDVDVNIYVKYKYKIRIVSLWFAMHFRFYYYADIEGKVISSHIFLSEMEFGHGLTLLVFAWL